MKVQNVCMLLWCSTCFLYAADGTPGRSKRQALTVDISFEKAPVRSIPEGFDEEDCTRAARGVTSTLSAVRRALENDSIIQDVRFFERVEQIITECAQFLTRPGVKDLYEACNEAKEVGYYSDLTSLDLVKAHFYGVEESELEEDADREYDADVSSSESEDDAPVSRSAGTKRGRNKHARGRPAKKARKK